MRERERQYMLYYCITRAGENLLFLFENKNESTNNIRVHLFSVCETEVGEAF